MITSAVSPSECAFLDQRPDRNRWIACPLSSSRRLGKTREAIDWAIRYRAEQEGKGPRDLLVADQNEGCVPAQRDREQLLLGAGRRGEPAGQSARPEVAGSVPRARREGPSRCFGEVGSP